MQYPDVILLAMALAVDALVVAFSYGLVIKEHRMRNACGIAVATGLGQFIMPLIGFLLTGSVHSYVEQWDHWIAFSVFFILGIRVIHEAFSNGQDDTEDIPRYLSFKILLVTAIATSIDALVAGASLFISYSMNEGGPGIVTASLIIGGVTYLCSYGGFMMARHMHRLPTKPLEIIAGLVLIGHGVKVLCEHLG